MEIVKISRLVKSEDLNHHGTLFAGRGAEWFVEACLFTIWKITPVAPAAICEEQSTSVHAEADPGVTSTGVIGKIDCAIIYSTPSSESRAAIAFIRRVFASSADSSPSVFSCM